MADYETGMIENFFPKKGYGFIRRSRYSVFVHVYDIALRWIPKKGDWVHYQLIYDGLGRPQAINVMPACLPEDNEA